MGGRSTPVCCFFQTTFIVLFRGIPFDIAKIDCVIHPPSRCIHAWQTTKILSISKKRMQARIGVTPPGKKKWELPPLIAARQGNITVEFFYAIPTYLFAWLCMLISYLWVHSKVLDSILKTEFFGHILFPRICSWCMPATKIRDSFPIISLQTPLLYKTPSRRPPKMKTTTAVRVLCCTVCLRLQRHAFRRTVAFHQSTKKCDEEQIMRQTQISTKCTHIKL